MRRQAQGWVTVGALGVLALLAASGLRQLAGLDSRIAQLMEHQRTDKDTDMNPLVTEVTNAGGTKITVTTHQEPRESDADQLARHLARVALAEASGG